MEHEGNDAVCVLRKSTTDAAAAMMGKEDGGGSGYLVTGIH